MNDKTNNKPDLNSTFLSTIRVEKANENDFETIKFLIQQFELVGCSDKESCLTIK